MGTILVIRKDSQSLIATNSINPRDPSIRIGLHSTPDTVIRIGESYIGLLANLGFVQAFEQAYQLIKDSLPGELNSTQKVYDFFSKIHLYMRAHSLMNVNYQPGQEFEWTPMQALVAHRSGIYRVDSTRAVYDLKRFWALGTGDAFALGALHAAYDSEIDARSLAQKALFAASEFSAADLSETRVYALASPTLAIAGGTTARPRVAKRVSKKVLPLK